MLPRFQIEQLRPGDMAVFSWKCQEHKCWTMPLPKSVTNGRELCFCPGTRKAIDFGMVPSLRQTGHLIELQRREKFEHPWRRLEGDQPEDMAFFVVQATMMRSLTDSEWSLIFNLITGAQ